MKLCLHEDDCLTTITSEQIPAVGSRILQEYIDKPLLISGYKSHIRLYVLITGADPLRLFVYQDAVIHLATEKYLSPAEGNLVSGFFFLCLLFCFVEELLEGSQISRLIDFDDSN